MATPVDVAPATGAPTDFPTPEPRGSSSLLRRLTARHLAGLGQPGHDRGCDAGGAQPAAPLAPGDRDHHRRRGHRGARRARAVLEVEPAATRAADRVGPRLVRRISALHLLLPVAGDAHRRAQRVHQLRRRLQVGHRPRHSPLAGLRVGVRKARRASRPGACLSRRGNPPLPLRAELHHLRREPLLHPRRRVLLLAQPLGRARLPRVGGERTPHRPASLARRGPLRGHPALPPPAGPVRGGRRGRLAGPRRGSAAGAAPRPVGPRRSTPVVAAPRLARGGGCDRRGTLRVVAGALCGLPALHDRHGLHQGARLSRTSSSRARPDGCSPRTWSASWPWWSGGTAWRSSSW